MSRAFFLKLNKAELQKKLRLFCSIAWYHYISDTINEVYRIREAVFANSLLTDSSSVKVICQHLGSPLKRSDA